MSQLITFEEIIEDVLEKEAGYVDHEADRGGPTNMGVTIHTMRSLSMDLDGDGDVDADDVKALTKEQAIEVYHKQYWLKAKCDKMPEHLRHIYFDMVVNFGPGGAGRVMQETANSKYAYSIKRGKMAPLVIDGAVGPATLGRMDVLELDRVRSFRMLRFSRIVHNNPTQSVFWYGWYRRCLEV